MRLNRPSTYVVTASTGTRVRRRTLDQGNARGHAMNQPEASGARQTPSATCCRRTSPAKTRSSSDAVQCTSRRGSPVAGCG
jgi:hypothetical protein